jgi:hypothetical protein
MADLNNLESIIFYDLEIAEKIIKTQKFLNRCTIALRHGPCSNKSKDLIFAAVTNISEYLPHDIDFNAVDPVEAACALIALLQEKISTVFQTYALRCADPDAQQWVNHINEAFAIIAPCVSYMEGYIFHAQHAAQPDVFHAFPLLSLDN